MGDISRMVVVDDYHTAGEPFRIVTGGVGRIPGDNVLAKRRYAMENLDEIRQLVVNEPRGHADMYGCFVVDPNDDGADFGTIFFHNAGYSTACGHGTIALATWAIDTGRIAAEDRDSEVEIVIDVPSGRLPTVAKVTDGNVVSVRFTNVPSYVYELGVGVETSRGDVEVDISFGGAFYAQVEASAFGLTVDKGSLPDLIRLGREIKHSIEAQREVVDHLEPELRDIYGVIFFDRLPDEDGCLVQKNVAIFADGEVDRSPCGSGTSARLALLDSSGELARGRTFKHLGIAGGAFLARVTEATEVAGVPAVITEVEGRSFPVGWHRFVLHRDDDLGTGFLLR
ncbi:MAG: proline racemase family protein [Actinomycetota bacterium]